MGLASGAELRQARKLASESERAAEKWSATAWELVAAEWESVAAAPGLLADLEPTAGELLLTPKTAGALHPWDEAGQSSRRTGPSAPRRLGQRRARVRQALRCGLGQKEMQAGQHRHELRPTPQYTQPTLSTFP